ncbi:MAG: hypothetical protein HY296_02425 [Thaumarchaeota archaeon]|nr:hypothetical protein [Nitrososphaerota archaeon]
MSGDQPRIDVDAANFRATIITSFLLGATMINLSLNVSIVKQSLAAGLMGTTEWLLAVSAALMLFTTMIMLFFSYVILQTMYLAALPLGEKLRRVGWVRTLLGISSFLIPTSYGSTFLVSFGLSSPWSWVFGGIGYGSGIVWAVLRGYYQLKVVRPRSPEPQR